MLSFFKKSLSRKSPTFKARVGEFWKWYAANADRFYSLIEAKQSSDLGVEVNTKVEELLPGFAWVFGPGENKAGHSFTLTAEGERHKQLLAMFWHSQAPMLKGWSFYPSRQPSDSIDGHKLTIDGVAFDPLEFWLTPHVDRERELIDIMAWHPLFPNIEERLRWTTLFLFLDEMLGEIATQTWIGRIEHGDQRLADSIPLTELPAFVANLGKETGWTKGAPGEIWSTYQAKEPRLGTFRDDIVAGTTCQFALISELENGMLDPDPLEGLGAEYVFVAFDARILPKGDEVARRSEIEDALESALTAAGEGRALGGALGLQYAYIDLLLWDGDKSIETLKRVLREQQLPKGTTIEYFAKSRRNERVRL